ncbi:MAG: ADP-glyceromanno-heptose 6-epimerase [Rhodospirillales bacterium]
MLAAAMYLVTGGAGFIGLNLVIALQARKAQGVAVCDRLDHPDKSAAMAAHKPIAFIEPDALDEFLRQRGSEITAVFHLGAISSTTETNWQKLQENNIDATLKLWQWCAQAKVPLIYASSAATYGDGSQGFDDDKAIAALQRLRPLNLYASSKHDTDLAIRRMLDAGQPAPPHWAGLKFFNVYGPHEHHKGEQRSIVNKLYDEITARGRAKLFRSHNPDYQDGGQLRDFIWVGDCVDVMLWLLDGKSVSGFFNVGTGQARSFLDVAQATFAAMDRTRDIEFIDMPLSLRDKYQYYTQAEMTRLRAAGYRRAFTSLEHGVRHYVRDYLIKDVG